MATSKWGVPAHPWREFPAGLSVWDWSSFVEWADTRADPRVGDWPLMSSIWPTVFLSVAYLVMVYGGKAVMRDRPAFQLNGAMVVYNVIVAASNAWMFFGLVSELIAHDYKFICNEVDYSPRGTRTAWLVYCYYLSKLVDFTDTAFMVLRRKFDQASFLHVYHHVAMFLIWWLAVKFCAGGDGVAGPVFNTFVHAVMYTYYLATSLKIHIPGKKYLTQLQMTQLFSVMSYSVAGIVLDCKYPHWTQYAQALFLLSLLYLFLAFYRGAYSRAKKRPSKKNL
jgi:elongation of very long chain fatty acids protein 4